MYTGIVSTLKNITFSAPADAIERARLSARQRRTTLNEAFREWIARYASGKPTSKDLERILAQMKVADSGGPFTRDEMNERGSSSARSR